MKIWEIWYGKNISLLRKHGHKNTANLSSCNVPARVSSTKKARTRPLANKAFIELKKYQFKERVYPGRSPPSKLMSCLEFIRKSLFMILIIRNVRMHKKLSQGSTDLQIFLEYD